MMTTKLPYPLIKLAERLKKLSGVGRKTAERYAFDLLLWEQKEIDSFIEEISELKKKISRCQECNVFTDKTECPFCKSDRRNRSLLCVLSSPKEVFTLEETQEFHGLYHVLSGLLSPIDGTGPSEIGAEKLIERVQKENIEEVILAFTATLEGDATALYLKDQFSALGIKTYRLAFGIPMGTQLDSVDLGTLSRAVQAKALF